MSLTPNNLECKITSPVNKTSDTRVYDFGYSIGDLELGTACILVEPKFKEVNWKSFFPLSEDLPREEGFGTVAHVRTLEALYNSEGKRILGYGVSHGLGVFYKRRKQLEAMGLKHGNNWFKRLFLENESFREYYQKSANYALSNGLVDQPRIILSTNQIGLKL